ncbi:MAG TPA: NifU family protein [Amycolatopsis sp.]|nr:NifU family protein [Amycolatopsis sp.]
MAGTPPHDITSIGEQIEQILGELDRSAGPGVTGRVEDLVRSLLEFYGAGLARVVELAREREGVLEALAGDEIVGGLLVLHDLHPVPTRERVVAALEKVRPYLGSHAGDVELLDIDADGVAHLRLTGTCDGCPSSRVTVQQAIEQGIRSVAPEITGIDVAGMVPEQPTGPGGRALLPLETVECPVPGGGP